MSKRSLHVKYAYCELGNKYSSVVAEIAIDYCFLLKQCYKSRGNNVILYNLHMHY